jgi:hypothetical protein
LFSEEDRPQVFAEKLDHVEVIGETGAISGESVNWVVLVNSSTHIMPLIYHRDGLRTKGKTAEIF